ncbi:MAG: hypothetical protein AAB350_03060 [Patescibacteria group bacterium]
MDKNPPQNKTPLRRPVRPIPQQQEEMVERISKMIGFLFIITAFCVDLFEMILEWLGIGILGLSTLISVCATAAFWIWFKTHSVHFSGKPKNMARFGTTSFLEMIPGLDAIFGFVWTVGIFALVASTMEEDGQGGIIVTIYQSTLKKIGL